MSKPIFSVYEASNSFLQKIGIEVQSYSVIDSTNKQAKNEAHFLTQTLKVYLANTQTAGRGRGQNVWLNPNADTGLLCTWSYLLEKSPQAIAAPLFGLAVYKSFHHTWPKTKFRIKAPNDIFIENKKFCGLLLEAIKCDDHHRLIVGLGANIFSHPIDELRATHLAAHTEVLDQNNWKKFLTSLNDHLDEAREKCIYNELTPSDQNAILDALNAYQPLTEQYSAVSPLGDLQLGSETISWRTL